MKAVLVAVIASGCLATVRTPPPPMVRSPRLGLELAKLELANGLRVIVVSDRTAPEVQVTMRYRAGAVDEPEGQAGVAHVVEHLMSEQVLGSQTIAAHLEAAASVHDGEVSHEATTFVARATRDHLDELLSIEAVRAGLRCASITDAAFERARGAVVDELKAHADAIGLDDAVTAALVPEGHPYRAQPAGSLETVAQLTRAQACAFADARYAPNNAVMVVSGNLTATEVATALQKFVTHIAKREIAPEPALPPGRAVAVRAEIQAPVAVPTVIFAWALSTDPAVRSRTRALARTLQLYAQAQTKGTIVVRELGDAREPMIALVATGDVPAELERVLRSVTQASFTMFDEAGAVPVGELAFDRMVAEGLYARLAALAGQGTARDVELAARALAGEDATMTLATELSALRTFRRADAGLVAAEAFGGPQIVVLQPVAPDKAAAMPLAIHDGAPAAKVAAPPPDLSEVRRRTLPNGMNVVLSPISSVPAVTAELSFPVGSATEPAADRLAHALRWDLRFLDDLKRFSRAAGGVHPEVDGERTRFVAHGVDSDLDTILAGLLRFVRDGELRDPALTPVRARSYTSDKATLELTGGFDADVATRWIDYLYGDWNRSRGESGALTEAPAPSNLSFAVHAAFAYAEAYQLDVMGAQIVGELGYRLDNITTVGLHVSGGFQRGSYLIYDNPDYRHTLDVYPFDLGAFVSGTFLERCYGTVWLAVHLSTGNDNGMTLTDSGLTAGLLAGVDLVTVDKRHDLRLGVYLAGQSELLDDSGYEAFSAGLALRH